MHEIKKVENHWVRARIRVRLRSSVPSRILTSANLPK